jgi:hypothetical protein
LQLQKLIQITHSFSTKVENSNQTAHLSVTVPSAGPAYRRFFPTCPPLVTTAFFTHVLKRSADATEPLLTRLIHAGETPPSCRVLRSPPLTSLLPPQVVAASQHRALSGFPAVEELLITGRLGSSSGAAILSSSPTTMPWCPLAQPPAPPAAPPA